MSVSKMTTDGFLDAWMEDQETYNARYALYEQKRFDKEKIDSLRDIKKHEYFTERGISNEHGGGGLFARDIEIMDWLFQTKG